MEREPILLNVIFFVSPAPNQVRWLLDVDESTPILDYRGQQQGELLVHLIPHLAHGEVRPVCSSRCSALSLSILFVEAYICFPLEQPTCTHMHTSTHPHTYVFPHGSHMFIFSQTFSFSFLPACVSSRTWPRCLWARLSASRWCSRRRANCPADSWRPRARSTSPSASRRLSLTRRPNRQAVKAAAAVSWEVLVVVVVVVVPIAAVVETV